MSALVGELDARLGSANAVVTDLVGGSWTGAGATAFADGWQDFHAGAVEVRQALKGISGLLAQAGVTYADTEHALHRGLASSDVAFAGAPAAGPGSTGGL